MAKQKSPAIKLQGSIGDISFYKSQDGFLAREKAAIDPARFKSDPAFRITRLNAAEFGTAGKAGKVFRAAWKEELRIAGDNRLTGRVAQTMMKVLQSDTTHSFGKRLVGSGNLALLEKFQFNRDVALDTVFTVPYVVTVDRPAGQITIALASFIPETSVTVPSGTTHFRLTAAAAEIDFVGEKSIVNRQATANLLWDNTPAGAINLPLPVTANSTLPVFVVLGIEFMKIINNEVFAQSKGLNALQLIQVSMP
jgi:hypothetical protein